MDKVIKILQKINPGVDFCVQKGLVENNILDSFDIINLVASIEEEFNIKIPLSYLQKESFDSASSIYNMILDIKKETV